MRRFLYLSLGQVAAGIGANVSTFCLGIWLYRQSQSVAQFSALMFSFTVPVVLLSGVAGRATERWNQQRTMLTADACGALLALTYVWLFEAELVTPWAVYGLTFLGGCVSAFQWPAFRSWSTRLVRQEDFGRVGGIMKLGEGVPHLLGPVLGGVLMSSSSLSTIFCLNLACSVLSVVVLLGVGGRDAEPATLELHARSENAERALSTFLRSRPGLSGLLIITPLIAFTEGWVITLFQPYMLNFVDADEMGMMLSLGGSGMVVGGIVMGIWGGPKRQLFSVLGAILVQSVLVCVLAMLTPTFYSGTIAAFFYFFTIPFLSGSNQAIWQLQTPLALQGQMFAFRRALESIATPASMLTAGLLVDYLLAPLLRRGGGLESLGTLVAPGPTQAIAVLLLVVAASNVLVLFGTLVYRPLRRVDLGASLMTRDKDGEAELDLVEGMSTGGRSI